MIELNKIYNEDCQHRFFNNYKRITVNEISNNVIDI